MKIPFFMYIQVHVLMASAEGPRSKRYTCSILLQHMHWCACSQGQNSGTAPYQESLQGGTHSGQRQGTPMT